MTQDASDDIRLLDQGDQVHGVTASRTRQHIELEHSVRTIIDHVAKANGATSDLDYEFSHPAIQNDPALVDLASSSAARVLGAAQVFDATRMTASEDFARYAEVAPVAFMILRVGPGAANHNPGFNLDEAALGKGVMAQVQLILDCLNQRR